MGLYLKGIAVCDGCQTTQDYKIPAPDGRGTWTGQPKDWKVVPVQAKSIEGNPVLMPNKIFCTECVARAEESRVKTTDESEVKDDDDGEDGM